MMKEYKRDKDRYKYCWKKDKIKGFEHGKKIAI